MLVKNTKTTIGTPESKSLNSKPRKNMLKTNFTNKKRKNKNIRLKSSPKRQRVKYRHWSKLTIILKLITLHQNLHRRNKNMLRKKYKSLWTRRRRVYRSLLQKKSHSRHLSHSLHRNHHLQSRRSLPKYCIRQNNSPNNQSLPLKSQQRFNQLNQQQQSMFNLQRSSLLSLRSTNLLL